MRKFSEEEIREIIRTLQVFAPSFTNDQYQKIIQMQEELADPEFIEAADELRRLRQEYGITYHDAPARYVKLLNDIAGAEQRLGELTERQRSQRDELDQTTKALEEVREEHHRQEEELKLFMKQAENEKQRLKDELEQAIQEANINREHIALAVNLKAEVEAHNLDLKLTLRLLEEFAGDEDAARLLAEAVAEYGSQLKARETLRRHNEAVMVEGRQKQEKLAEVEAECQRKQEVLLRLQADLAEQERLRRFWRRFAGRSKALEYLAKWGQVIPMRCYALFCGARFWVDLDPTNFRTKHVCPCCGRRLVDFDDEALTTLGLSFRGPFQINLGE
jgi:DNA repair exonuclease SbcCD ATPase subunit